jgi:hypothetical protein
VATSKQATSYRLSAECRELITRLAGRLGISQAGVIEQAVRKLARAEFAQDSPGTAEQPGPSPRPRKK